MTDDKILLALIQDRIDQATDRYMVTAGDFMDMHRRKVVTDYLRSCRIPPARFDETDEGKNLRYVMFGGYDDAERCMAVFLPDYGGQSDLESLLKVVRVSAPKGSRRLTHRDYLGSVLALGITRDVVGDILVREPDERTGGGADIIVQAEIADFIEMNYDKAGRTNLSCEVLPLSELDPGTVNITQKRDTLASLRLDNVVSSAFGISRAKAAEAIRRGIVSVNSMEALKTDMQIAEGDKVVLRGKGKVLLAEIGDKSRKDRTYVTFNIYR